MLNLLDEINKIEKLGVTQFNFSHQTPCGAGGDMIYDASYLEQIKGALPYVLGLVSNYVKPEGRSKYMKFLDAYFTESEMDFFSKYGYEKNEAPHVIISVSLMLNHYSLGAQCSGVKVNISEIPFNSFCKYYDDRDKIFKDMSPNAIAIRLKRKEPESLVILGLDDNDLAYWFSMLMQDAPTISGSQLLELEEDLAKVAAKEDISHEDAALVASVVKAAHEMGLYRTEPLSSDPECSVYKICFECLKAFGYKKLSDGCCIH